MIKIQKILFYFHYLLQKKQLNPWNKFKNNLTKNLYTKIDEIKSFDDKANNLFLSKINTTNVKRFYLAMEFNKINNEEFYDEKLYSLSDILYYNRTPLYTPQINNISMMLPETPVLYKWNSIDRVPIFI
jgi:hypothetical protein